MAGDQDRVEGVDPAIGTGQALNHVGGVRTAVAPRREAVELLVRDVLVDGQEGVAGEGDDGTETRLPRDDLLPPAVDEREHPLVGVDDEGTHGPPRGHRAPRRHGPTGPDVWFPVWCSG